ncbi:hypothetical protein SLA2020_275970 [Shorea laevis]
MWAGVRSGFSLRGFCLGWVAGKFCFYSSLILQSSKEILVPELSASPVSGSSVDAVDAGSSKELSIVLEGLKIA